MEILRHRYIKGSKQIAASIEKQRHATAIVAQIYQLRIKMKLSQRELAKLVGTTQSVISKLEDADYQGHRLRMLEKIADVMGCFVEVYFVPRKRHYSRSA